MKHLLTLLLISGLGFTAAADITIADPAHVLVDGIDTGHIVDTALNLAPSRRAELVAAVAVWANAQTSAKATAQAELAETQTFAATIIANAKALLATPDETTLTKLAALLDQAATPAQQREIARLEAEKAKLEADLAAKKAALGQ